MAAVTLGVGYVGPPASAPKRRRRWIGAVVGAWIVVLALISWWSIRNDPATVPEQRSIEQAMPSLREAAGVLLTAAESAAARGGPVPWAVRLGEVRSESCSLTPVRPGVQGSRDVVLYVPQGQAKAAFDQVAAALPGDFHASVLATRVATRLSFYADAGNFIAVDGEAQPDDQVLVLSAGTGCRPGTTAGGSDPAPGAAPAVLGETLAALGGPAGAAVTTETVACPGGGTAATYQATAGRSGDGPRGVPAGVTPVWSQAGGWAYAQGPVFVVVDDNGENLRLSVTTTCGQ
jgi:hypothetical protein